MSRTSALTRKPKGLGRRNFAQGYPRSHATQGQKVKSQSGAGAYCGGHLAAQLVTSYSNTSIANYILQSISIITLLMESRYMMLPSGTRFTCKMDDLSWIIGTKVSNFFFHKFTVNLVWTVHGRHMVWLSQWCEKSRYCCWAAIHDELLTSAMNIT